MNGRERINYEQKPGGHPCRAYPARHLSGVRGEKVMLDADLAALYGVSTGNLNKAVKRNRQRFPLDFMFQLSQGETKV